MAIGKDVRGGQRDSRTGQPGALDKLLEEHGFDDFAEETRECGEAGPAEHSPGVYFRMLMVGYLEGIGSERGIVAVRGLDFAA